MSCAGRSPVLISWQNCCTSILRISWVRPRSSTRSNKPKPGVLKYLYPASKYPSRVRSRLWKSGLSGCRSMAVRSTATRSWPPNCHPNPTSSRWTTCSSSSVSKIHWVVRQTTSTCQSMKMKRGRTWSWVWRSRDTGSSISTYSAELLVLYL